MHFLPFKILGLFFLAALFFSCKADESPHQTEEGPFFDFFNDSSIIVDTTKVSATTWEYGFVFTPLKSGQIRRLGIKLPSQGSFTATLWDLSGPTPVVLKTKTVDATILDGEIYSDIPPIGLKEGVKYGITLISNSFYRVRRAGNAKFSFPRTVGNIRIESFNEAENNTGTPTFPLASNDTRVAPCVNVTFIAD